MTLFIAPRGSGLIEETTEKGGQNLWVFCVEKSS